MNRCESGLRAEGGPTAVDPVRRRLALMLQALGLGSALMALPTAPTVAQTTDLRARVFPPGTLRGRLKLGAFPEAWMNGQPVTLSPGARIRQTDNLLVQPQQVTGQDLTVHYRLEGATGQIREIWLLSAAEAALTPWPTLPQHLQTWRQDPQTQRWTPAP